MKSTYVYEHWCQAIPREARRRLLLGVPGSGRLAFRHDEFVMKEFNAKLKSVMRVHTYIHTYIHTYRFTAEAQRESQATGDLVLALFFELP